MDTGNREGKLSIGVAILATRAYILLGLRFIHMFRKHYKGSSKITFHLFSDTSPSEYIDTSDIVHRYSTNTNWVEGANSKFLNIKKLSNTDEDYIFFFDADTGINKDFTEDWFIGEKVGGQHFGDKLWMREEKDYDREPLSTAYIPYDTKLDQTYYYGAFFGGSKDIIIELCETIHSKQEQNNKIDHEPIYNDESYLNREFHYNPPTRVIPCDQFQFVISEKGSIKDLRNSDKSFYDQLQFIKKNYNRPFDIVDGRIVFV